MAASDSLIAPSVASASAPLTLALGIATSGRPAILAETLGDLARQIRQPDQVFVLYSKDEDVANLPQQFPGFHFFKGTGGLCEKRNQIMDATAEADILFFMDDDFYLDANYLHLTEEAFRSEPALVATTGFVAADGARGPGLTVAQAKRILGSLPHRAPQLSTPVFNTYGCNMAFRLAAARKHGVRFDERLPAYAWYEDIDFSRRMARFGLVMRLRGAIGVHLGAKVGRVSGQRLGYSQVANPVYLSRKGSFPWANTVRSIARNFLANLVRSIAPESYVDRRGRLRGNLLAFRDMVRGQMRPDRILEMH